jgi:hypothetical protein
MTGDEMQQPRNPDKEAKISAVREELAALYRSQGIPGEIAEALARLYTPRCRSETH